MIGMKKLHTGLFDLINWGEDTVLEETLAVAKKLKLTVQLISELKDLDDENDLPSGW